MDIGKQVDTALKDLIRDFVSEIAYQKMDMLTQASRNLCFQMQANLVNAQHIWGDAINADNPAVRRLSISVSIKNLQTFLEAITAAKELYLILPDHLVVYQDRAEKIIVEMQKIATEINGSAATNKTDS